jgi:hypothetical protein
MHLILPSALAEVLKQPYALPRTELHLSIIMLTSYFFVLNKLWTLCTLWRSFGSPDPLFSSFYRLFLQKTGWWGTPDGQDSGRPGSQGRIINPIMGINQWISWVTHGANIDAPYHLC